MKRAFHLAVSCLFQCTWKVNDDTPGNLTTLAEHSTKSSWLNIASIMSHLENKSSGETRKKSEGSATVRTLP